MLHPLLAAFHSTQRHVTRHRGTEKHRDTETKETTETQRLSLLVVYPYSSCLPLRPFLHHLLPSSLLASPPFLCSLAMTNPSIPLSLPLAPLLTQHLTTTTTTTTMSAPLQRALRPALRRAMAPLRRRGSTASTGGRLPSNTPPYDTEFPQGVFTRLVTRFREASHLTRNAVQRSVATLLRPQNVAGLFISTLMAAAIGVAEGRQRLVAAAALLDAAGVEVDLHERSRDVGQDLRQVFETLEHVVVESVGLNGEKNHANNRDDEPHGGDSESSGTENGDPEHGSRDVNQQTATDVATLPPMAVFGAVVGAMAWVVSSINSSFGVKLLTTNPSDEDEDEDEDTSALGEPELNPDTDEGAAAAAAAAAARKRDARGSGKNLRGGARALAALDADIAAFALAYGIEQIPAAFAMLTAEPLQVAEAHGLWRAARLLRAASDEERASLDRPGRKPTPDNDPTATAPAPLPSIATPVDHDAGQIAAVQALRAQRLAYLRLALTQIVILTQMLRLVNAGLRAREAFRMRVLRGQQAPVPFAAQRVVRLCGESSDTGALSLQRCGREHILPVFENPAAVQPIVRRLSRDGEVPFYWSVAPGTYGQAHAWRGLATTAFTRHTLLPRSAPQRPVLYLEADATNAAHALAFAGRSADLSVADAAMGFRMLAQLARASPKLRYVNYDVIRVFLGYPEECIRSGGGQTLTAVQAMLDMGQADIFIDARAPMLIQVLRWVINTGAREWHRTLVFATDTPAYFDQLRELLRPHGFHVVDPLEPSRIVREHLPHLVYYRTTMDTCHHVETLVRQHIVPADRICALLDSADGLDALADLEVRCDSGGVVEK